MGSDDAGINRRAVLGGATAISALAASAKAQEKDVAPDLTGKAILITGASSGFGYLGALHYARLGAVVIASMRNLDNGKRAEAQQLKAAAADEKLNLSVVEIDVTKDDQVAAGVAQAEAIARRALDVVVNNAGIGVAGPIELYTQAQLHRAMDVNLYGYHRIARAALPKMRNRGQGLLVQVSSQLGRIILPNIGTYCATKFAVEAMFEAMAYELAPFGVDVTIVQPGGYPTKIWEKGERYFAEMMDDADDARKEAYAGHVAMAEGFFNGGGTTDPMDVPRAIAALVASPVGKRPLRKPVHPNTEATDALNAAHAQVQSAVLQRGRYKGWHEAVTD